MRIGMMSDVYKPHVSGITNYIELNKRFLSKFGHDVFIFTFGDEDYQDEETNVIRSPGFPLLDTGYYVSLRYSPLAKKLLRTMDVVHVHHPFLSGSLALRYCLPRGIPVIFTNHTRYDLYARAYLPILPDIISESALEAYLPAFCRACTMVISPSYGMRDILRKLGVTTSIEVVPNGVDLSLLRGKLIPVSRESLGIESSDIVLIYSGRLGPEKNLPFLLRCFAGLIQAYKNAYLILVGDGPERNNLIEIVNIMGISSHVRFVGMVPYSEVFSYLVSSDVFVTASISEVHPLSVIEAMAVGLPVLGISSPGISDIVEDGVTGLLVASEDLAAFTAKMVRLIYDRELREQMGKNAQINAENYSIERTVTEILRRYENVIAESKSHKHSLKVFWTKVLDRWRN